MDVRGITISDRGSRDRASSVWAEADARGWVVTVCVSNVAAAISKDSVFDSSARRRVEAEWIQGKQGRPMLQRRFSEGKCSVTFGKPIAVIAIRIRLNHELETQFVSIDESTLTSEGQIGYAEVSKILRSGKGNFHKIVARLKSLASGLSGKRLKSGAFAIYDLRAGLVTTESGQLTHLKNSQDANGWLISQELMILANSEIARFCANNNIPVPFRNHTARASAPERSLMIEDMILGLGGGDVARRRYSMVVNSPNYGPTIMGHYGLNLPAYVHGTSPIRRYADLIVQRQVSAFIKGLRLPYNTSDIAEISEHINSTLKARSKKLSGAELKKEKHPPSQSNSYLEHLPDKEFGRVLRQCIQVGKFNPAVSESFIGRLMKDAASVQDIKTVLLSSSDDWAPAQQLAIKHIIKHPYKATAIAAMMSQSGGWSPPRYKIQRGGERGLIEYTAQVYFETPGIKSSAMKARSLKLAKQLATANALSAFVGYSDE